jgi:hypothetical protein
VKEYKIVGNHSVVGHESGSIITDDDLAAVDVQHLIDAGHITPVSKATKVAPVTNEKD